VGQEATAATTVSVATATADGSIPAPTTADAEVVLHAADVASDDINGRWRRVTAASAASGVALENTDLGEPKRVTALAVPSNYVDLRFNAEAGMPYWMWMRMRATGDDYASDSVFVQFSGSVTSSGTSTHRIGTTSARAVVLEDCTGDGRSGWGWNDSGWCGMGTPIYFKATGPQTVRVQQREDGVIFDQIVLSADEYAGESPGALKNDTTIVEGS
jgi:hypothetical protein